jgi:NADPH:quinone reductase-like Zn-dependent oxidoreductase
VRAASVNPVDFKIRSGKYPAVKEDRLPYTLGRDVSGVVEKCGAQATAFKVGDEVFGMVGINGGGYAAKAVLDQKAIARKPASLDHIHAAAIPLAGQTAWQGLFRHGQLKAGQSVLIHGGAGGVGHFAVQFAKAKGARVLTTVSTDNVDFARSLGADVVIDYKTQEFDDVVSGYDVVLDSQGGDTLARSLCVLKPGGIAIGIAGPPDPAFARQLGRVFPLLPVMALLSFKTRRAAKRLGVRYSFLFMQASGAQLAEIAKLADAGTLRPIVDRTYPLAQAPDALAYVEAGRSKGKVVIEVTA